MALDGDLIVAGAPDTDLTTGNAEGAAYVFQRDSSGNWNQLVRLEAHDGSSANTQSNASFGSAVGIHGNTVIVGARGYSSNSGRAYIYQDASVTNNGPSANCDASTAPTNGGRLHAHCRVWIHSPADVRQRVHGVRDELVQRGHFDRGDVLGECVRRVHGSHQRWRRGLHEFIGVWIHVPTVV